MGVLVTLFDRRTALSKDVEAHIRQVFGEKAFKPLLRAAIRLEESPAHKGSDLQLAASAAFVRRR